MIEEGSIFHYDSWEAFANHVGRSQEDGEWEELQQYLHAGFMAIVVDGLPRFIEGTIH
jgi:hypothetical protein